MSRHARRRAQALYNSRSVLAKHFSTAAAFRARIIAKDDARRMIFLAAMGVEMTAFNNDSHHADLQPLHSHDD